MPNLMPSSKEFEVEIPAATSGGNGEVIIPTTDALMMQLALPWRMHTMTDMFVLIPEDDISVEAIGFFGYWSPLPKAIGEDERATVMRPLDSNDMPVPMFDGHLKLVNSNTHPVKVKIGGYGWEPYTGQ